MYMVEFIQTFIRNRSNIMQPSCNRDNFHVCSIFACQKFRIFDHRNNMVVTPYPKFIRLRQTSVVYFLL